jgi:viroplasmin and RNaseH domain-containing protein
MKNNYKRFNSMKKAEAFLEENKDWCSVYLKWKSGYIVFRTLEEYKEFSENNKKALRY